MYIQRNMIKHENIELSEKQKENLRKFQWDCSQPLTKEDIRLLRKLAFLSLILTWLYSRLGIYLGIAIIPIVIASVRSVQHSNANVLIITLMFSFVLYIIAVKTVFSGHKKERKYQLEFYKIAKTCMNEHDIKENDNFVKTN